MNGRPRRAEPLAGLFIAVAWGASTFAAAGLLAVVLDRDPVESDVPRLYGVIALVTAALWVWLAVTLSARSSRIPWPTALVAAAAVYFSFAVSGFVVGAALLVEQASSPFVIAGALLASVAVIATWAALRRQAG